jgi:hypothetical protein
VPSEHLSVNEIAAATLADQGEVFNPQQQFRVTWPAEPAVAGAYVDQLQRASALPGTLVDDLTQALEQAGEQLQSGSSDAQLAARLESLAATATADGGAAVSDQRRAALAETLLRIASRLR